MRVSASDHNMKVSVVGGHQLNVYGTYDCQAEMHNQVLRAHVIVVD
jgi:hypothetical protein